MEVSSEVLRSEDTDSCFIKWTTKFVRLYTRTTVKIEQRSKELYKCAFYGGFPKGAIIGSVVIADCVQNHPSVWAEKGCWNWVLKDVVLFDKPIMNVKGKLGFWEFNNLENI